MTGRTTELLPGLLPTEDNVNDLFWATVVNDRRTALPRWLCVPAPTTAAQAEQWLSANVLAQAAKAANAAAATLLLDVLGPDEHPTRPRELGGRMRTRSTTPACACVDAMPMDRMTRKALPSQWGAMKSLLTELLAEA